MLKEKPKYSQYNSPKIGFPENQKKSVYPPCTSHYCHLNSFMNETSLKFKNLEIGDAF